jgi:hypothetical protein
MAEPRYRGDIGGGLRKDDRVRRRPVDGAVVLIEEEVVVRAEDFRGAE